MKIVVENYSVEQMSDGKYRAAVALKVVDESGNNLNGKFSQDAVLSGGSDIEPFTIGGDR